MNWLLSPWTTPRIQLTPLLELLMGVEIVVVLIAFLWLVYIVGRLGTRFGFWRFPFKYQEDKR